MPAKPWGMGGCLCGAVRYELLYKPCAKHICYCHICKKNTGSDKAEFAEIKRQSFKITQGEISIYKSSSRAQRGFCANCGSSLTYDSYDENISILIGSLDEIQKSNEIETQFIHHKNQKLIKSSKS